MNNYKQIFNPLTGRFDTINAPSVDVTFDSGFTNPRETATYDTTPLETTPSSLEVTTDGMRLHVVGADSGQVRQLVFSTTYDLTTVTAVNSYNYTAQAPQASGVSFSEDGMHFYIARNNSNIIYWYSLSTPWDLTTVTFNSQYAASEVTNNSDVRISNDGSAIFIGSRGDFTIYKYNLTTPYDITTAVYSNQSYSDGNWLGLDGFDFTPDGNFLYTVDQTAGNLVYKYSLVSPYDLTNVSFIETTNLSPFVFGLVSVTVSKDSGKLYSINHNDDDIKELIIGTALTVQVGNESDTDILNELGFVTKEQLEVSKDLDWIRVDGEVSKNIEDNIYTNGNVGIGTTSLPESLNVSGNAQFGGEGNGTVGITVDDGAGQANITFNHTRGIPDTNGSSARIESRPDDTSGALFSFQGADNVTSGVAATLDEIALIRRNGGLATVTIFSRDNSGIHVESELDDRSAVTIKRTQDTNELGYSIQNSDDTHVFSMYVEDSTLGAPWDGSVTISAIGEQLDPTNLSDHVTFLNPGGVVNHTGSYERIINSTDVGLTINDYDTKVVVLSDSSTDNSVSLPDVASDLATVTKDSGATYSGRVITIKNQRLNDIIVSSPNSTVEGQSQYILSRSQDDIYPAVTFQANADNSDWSIISSHKPDEFINPFIFTVDTSQTGTSNSDQFQLPLINGGTYNFIVFWGDGTMDTITSNFDPEILHTYPTPGTYEVTIYGVIRRWQIGAIDPLKLVGISRYGGLEINNQGAFQNCSNLVATAEDQPTIVPGTTSLVSMYSGCTLFNSPLNGLDVSNVVLFGDMFNGASAFNQPLDNWDTSSATNFLRLFVNSSFNQTVPWNTSNVINMSRVFENTPFNQSIPWDTSSVTNFERFLYNAVDFNQEINFDASSATSVRDMFTLCSSFNSSVTLSNSSNISNFTSMFNLASVFNSSLNIDTSSGTNMTNMFKGCSLFNQDINYFNTSNVVTMSEMFNGATSFDQPINSWDVSSVTVFNRFLANTPFNQPLDNWDTSNAIDMQWMFNGASNFDQDLSSWDFTSVTNMTNFLNGAQLSTPNYDALLVRLASFIPVWTTNGTTPNVFNGGASQYTIGSAAETARTDLINFGITLTDGGGI